MPNLRVVVRVAVQGHLVMVVHVVVRDGDVVGSLLDIDHAVERRVACSWTVGHRAVELVVVDPDVGRNPATHPFQRNHVGIAPTRCEADGHVADHDVARRRGDVDAKIGAGAVGTQDGDVALLLDLQRLCRQGVLHARISDSREIELARVLEDQAAGSGIAINSCLHGRQVGDSDRRDGATASGALAIAKRAGLRGAQSRRGATRFAATRARRRGTTRCRVPPGGRRPPHCRVATVVPAGHARTADIGPPTRRQCPAGCRGPAGPHPAAQTRAAAACQCPADHGAACA